MTTRLLNGVARRFSVLSLCALTCASGAAAQAPGEAAKPRPQPVVNPPYTMFRDQQTGKQNMLPMIQRSVLQNVEGRLNQLAVDPLSNRAYIAAKNGNSVEMLEVTTSKQLPPIRGLLEPAGVLVLKDERKLIVSCGGDNSVRTYALDAFGEPTPEKTIKFEGEVDVIRADGANKRVYVGHGRKIGSFSLETGERGPSLELPAMPEAFSIDPSSDRVYINLQSQGSVAVATRDAKTGEMKLETTWKLKDASGNYASALDPAAGHYFAVCRNPGRLIVLDTKTGEQIASLACIGDSDSAWWDPVQKRVYVSGGEGSGRVDIFQQGAPAEAGKPATYSILHTEVTNVGARTSVMIPEQRRLIVAAPKIGADPAFLYIYLIGP